MKWMIALAALVLGTLVLAFMTPDGTSGDLLSFRALADAFSGGSVINELKAKTPGRVVEVAGNTAAHLAGKTLSATTGALGPIIDSTRRQELTEEAQESASSFIPKTNEQKREALISQLEARVSELEVGDFEEVEALKKELEELTKELKKVQEESRSATKKANILKCEKCKKSFRSSGGLTRHMKTHK